MAPVVDIAMKKPQCTNNRRRNKEDNDNRQQRTELLMVSGSNNTSHINIIQKGISIKDHVMLDQIPPIFNRDGLFTAGDKIFYRVFGYSQLLATQVALKSNGIQKTLQVLEIELPSNNFKLEWDEQIHCLSKINEEVILITDSRIQIYSEDLKCIFLDKKMDDNVTKANLSGNTLIVSTESDNLILLRITKGETEYTLSKLDSH